MDGDVVQWLRSNVVGFNLQLKTINKERKLERK